MAAALPVTKLAGLFVKTLAKPLSKRIKHDFARFDTTKSLLISIGQINHTVTSYMTIWSSGYKVKSIKSIDADKAMKDGAEFVGEGFVLAVSMSIVIFEYNRSAQKLIEKNEMKRERIKATQAVLQAKLNTLDIRIKAVENLIKEQQYLDDKGLLGRVATVTVSKKPKYVEPPKEQLVPIIDDPIDDHNEGVTVAVSTTEKETNETAENRIKNTITADSNSIESLEPSSVSSWWKFW